MSDVTLEEVDGVLLVCGSTYAFREGLKQLGLRWNWEKRAWYTPNNSTIMVNSIRRVLGVSLAYDATQEMYQEDLPNPLEAIQKPKTRVSFANTQQKSQYPEHTKQETILKGKVLKQRKEHFIPVAPQHHVMRVVYEDTDEDEHIPTSQTLTNQQEKITETIRYKTNTNKKQIQYESLRHMEEEVFVNQPTVIQLEVYSEYD